MHLCTTTCPALILEHQTPAHSHPSAAPAGTRSQATTLSQRTSTSRANAPTTCATRSCLALYAG
eukprot:1515619-Pleurochrysis_carterae.AAC.1